MKPSISDKAVSAKTGKIWKEWFQILDRAGAKKKTHRDIARWLRQEHGVGDWWCQMVTVEYEKARGLRKAHEKPSGFEVSASKVFEAGVSVMKDFFTNDIRRDRWMGEKTKVRTSTSKSMRLDWPGEQILSIGFYPRGKPRSQITIQHMKIPSQKQALAIKTLWKKKLEVLYAKIMKDAAHE